MSSLRGLGGGLLKKYSEVTIVRDSKVEVTFAMRHSEQHDTETPEAHWRD